MYKINDDYLSNMLCIYFHDCGNYKQGQGLNLLLGQKLPRITIDLSRSALYTFN